LGVGGVEKGLLKKKTLQLDFGGGVGNIKKTRRTGIQKRNGHAW